MIDLNMIWVDFECPKCNYSDTIQLVDVKTEKTVFCHNCKISVQLKDEEASVHNAINTIGEGINKITKQLKR